MLNKKYRLSYLPLFYEELDEKVVYIAEKLQNPKAANDLLDKVEAAILERLPIAESFTFWVILLSFASVISVYTFYSLPAPAQRLSPPHTSDVPQDKRAYASHSEVPAILPLQSRRNQQDNQAPFSSAG